MALGMTLFPYFPSYEFKDIVERMKQVRVKTKYRR